MKTSPILIATPRSGSTLICAMLGKIATTHLGYSGVLDEYFSIFNYYKRTHQVDKNNNIYLKYIESRIPWLPTLEEKEQEVQRLVDQLSITDKMYMIKLMPKQLLSLGKASVNIRELCVSKYNFRVFLERRDKFKQFLSYLAMTSTGIAHYSTNSNYSVSEISFNYKTYETFRMFLGMYNTCKLLIPDHNVLVYEDFIDAGNNISALVDLLKLPEHCKNTEFMPVTTAVPYKSIDIESLISNKQDWYKYKNKIYDELSSM